MDEYFSFNRNKRQGIKEGIKKALLREKSVIFAFVFGSFLNSPFFRDIDVAVYVNKIKKDKIFDYELNLAEKIAKECGLSFDIFEIKVLNFAPSSFLNNVFNRGELLFSKDNELLSDMIENTSLDALANEYIARQSLKELVPA